MELVRVNYLELELGKITWNSREGKLLGISEQITWNWSEGKLLGIRVREN